MKESIKNIPKRDTISLACASGMPNKDWYDTFLKEKKRRDIFRGIPNG